MTGMAAPDMPLSSPDPSLVNFLGFADIAVYFLMNDLLGDLGEIRHQGAFNSLNSGHNICSMKLLGPLIAMI
jgi:hypothetical protein